MAAGNDLIGPKRSPRGLITGLDVRAGDTIHPLNVAAGNIPFGPVVSAIDPTNSTVRFFRFGIQIQDNGDGTTSAVIIATEIDSEGTIVP